MEWFFDGFGTELMSLAAGLLVGGGGGYYVGRRSVRQVQRARDNAVQTQVGGDQNNFPGL